MAKIIQLKPQTGYQLKITLNRTKPAVWRRFTVSADIKLPDLSRVIQAVMGWTNTHLHQFVKDNTIYAQQDEENSEFVTDYRKLRLNQILTRVKESIRYEYDFGDGWEHKIVLEKILQDYKDKYPVCLAGKRDCPPEDCGGPFGYQRLLDVITDPENPEYEGILDWLGDSWDPEFFDESEVSEKLKKKNFGCIDLY